MLMLVGNQSHYQDVYVFTDCIHDMATTKTKSLVKNNVHACLRETALSWHTIELSNLEKLALRTATLEDGWIKALIKRFKPRISESIDKIQNASFSMIDV